MGFQINSKTALPKALAWLRTELKTIPDKRRIMKEWIRRRGEVLVENRIRTHNHLSLPRPPLDPYRFSDKKVTLLNMLNAQLKGRNHLDPNKDLDEAMELREFICRIGLWGKCSETLTQEALLRRWVTHIDRLTLLWEQQENIPIHIQKELILNRNEVVYAKAIIERATKVNSYKKAQRRAKDRELLRKL